PDTFAYAQPEIGPGIPVFVDVRRDPADDRAAQAYRPQHRRREVGGKFPQRRLAGDALVAVETEVLALLQRAQLLERVPPVADIQFFVVVFARLPQPLVADVTVVGEPLFHGVKLHQHLRAITF